MSFWYPQVTARAVLTGLTFGASIGVAGFTYASVTHGGDPARRAFTTLKVSVSLFVLAALLDTVCWGMTAYLQSPESFNKYELGSDGDEKARDTSVYLMNIVFNIYRLSDAAAFLTLVFLARGIKMVQTGEPLSKPIRIVTGTVAGLLACLAIVDLGMTLELNNISMNEARLYAGDVDWSELWRKYTAVRSLYLANGGISVLAAVGLVAGAVMTLRGKDAVTSTSFARKIFLAGSLLWFVRALYSLTRAAESYYNEVRGTYPISPLYLEIVDVGLAMWPLLIILLLATLLGRRKRNGLWSTEHEGREAGVAPRKADAQGNLPSYDSA